MPINSVNTTSQAAGSSTANTQPSNNANTPGPRSATTQQHMSNSTDSTRILTLNPAIHAMSIETAISRMEKAKTLTAAFQTSQARTEPDTEIQDLIQKQGYKKANKPTGLTSGRMDNTPIEWSQATNRRDKMQDICSAFNDQFNAGGTTHFITVTSVFDGNDSDYYGTSSRNLGLELAQSASQMLQSKLIANLQRFNKNELNELNLYNAFRQTLVDLNSPATYADSLFLKSGAGATANIAATINGTHYCINTGDSRSLLLVRQKNNQFAIIQTSEDQSIETDVQSRRQRFDKNNIAKHNGKKIGRYESRVLKEGDHYQLFNPWRQDYRRTNGLNIARYIGNQPENNTSDALASPVLTALPKITPYNLADITKQFDALEIHSLQCSDGIFKALSSEEAGNFVLNQLTQPSNTSAAEALVRLAAATGRTGDNSTAIITKLV